MSERRWCEDHDSEMFTATHCYKAMMTRSEWRTSCKATGVTVGTVEEQVQMRVAALRVQEGDVLVVSAPEGSHPEMLWEMEQIIHHALLDAGHRVPIVVLPGLTEIAVLDQETTRTLGEQIMMAVEEKAQEET